MEKIFIDNKGLRIKSIKHLRNDAEYNDQYDKFTVDECRRWEKIYLKRPTPEYKGKVVFKEEQKRISKYLSGIILYAVRGSHYARKSETINSMKIMNY